MNGIFILCIHFWIEIRTENQKFIQINRNLPKMSNEFKDGYSPTTIPMLCYNKCRPGQPVGTFPHQSIHQSYNNRAL